MPKKRRKRRGKLFHYDRLSFLLPVTKSSKSRDTFKRKNEEQNEEVEETRFSMPGLKKKSIAERKIELLSECTEAITKKPVDPLIVSIQPLPST